MIEEAASEEEFTTLPQLLRALGYDVHDDDAVTTELEDYAESYLSHDSYVTMTDWDRTDPDGYVVLESDGVVMWNLQFPTTLGGFHHYLDEFDQRVGRMRGIAVIPDPDDEDEESARRTASAVAQLFGVTADCLQDDLGTSWKPLECDAVGSHTNPVAYVCWANQLAVGFDDQYVYVLRMDPYDGVLDAYDGGVIWESEWSGDDYIVLGYEDFVSTLQAYAARPGACQRPTQSIDTLRPDDESGPP